jgi:hypothetical protein
LAKIISPKEFNNIQAPENSYTKIINWWLELINKLIKNLYPIFTIVDILLNS